MTVSCLTSVCLHLGESFLRTSFQTAIASLVPLDHLAVTMGETAALGCWSSREREDAFLLLTIWSITKFWVGSSLETSSCVSCLHNHFMLIIWDHSVCYGVRLRLDLTYKPLVVDFNRQDLGWSGGDAILSHIKLVELLSRRRPVCCRVRFTLVNRLGKLNNLSMVLAQRQAFWGITLPKAFAIVVTDAHVWLDQLPLVVFLVQGPLPVRLFFILTYLQITMREMTFTVFTMWMILIWIWICSFSNVSVCRRLAMWTGCLGILVVFWSILGSELIAACMRTFLIRLVIRAIFWWVARTFLFDFWIRL